MEKFPRLHSDGSRQAGPASDYAFFFAAQGLADFAHPDFLAAGLASLGAAGFAHLAI
jgi:hypothetical protein